MTRSRALDILLTMRGNYFPVHFTMDERYEALNIAIESLRSERRQAKEYHYKVVDDDGEVINAR